MKDQIIDVRNIRLQAHADNWKDALQLSGQLLVESGCITEEYIGKTIRTVEEMGPYIVIGPGLALAHSRPDGSVLETAISLLTLNEPVDFESELGPVSVVITLAAMDDSSHIDKMQAVAVIFSNETNMEIIMKAKDQEVVLQMFNNWQL